jgi:hypothetical protein
MQDPQRPLPRRARTLEMLGGAGWLAVIICLFLSQATRAFAQSNQAIVVDGSGPWQNDQWNFTVAQFNSLLTGAGYTGTTVSPVPRPSRRGAFPGPAVSGAQRQLSGCGSVPGRWVASAARSVHGSESADSLALVRAVYDQLWAPCSDCPTTRNRCMRL